MTLLPKLYPDNVEKVMNWLDKYDFVVPIIYQQRLGQKAIVSIYGHDFLALLQIAGVAPLIFCPNCGHHNNYQEGNFIKQGKTYKGRQVWKCKECNKKISTLGINN